MRLATTAADFMFDYLDVGFRLVSGKLREVMELTADHVQSLDVDASGCPLPVRAMD